jgi:hypothetical protein
MQSALDASLASLAAGGASVIVDLNNIVADVDFILNNFEK